jgi:hypothetical protein
MMRQEAVNSAIMEQGQNSSVFEADQLLAQTLAQLRPVYRQALIDVYGGDLRITVSSPYGKVFCGLRLSELDEELAREVLWACSESSLSHESDHLSPGDDEHDVSELAVVLPFILCSLLLVETYCEFHLFYFRNTLEHQDDFNKLVKSLHCLPREQRKIIVSAMRFALMCYSNYATGDGVGDCMSYGADDRVRDLIYCILVK